EPDTDAWKADALHQRGQPASEQIRTDQERDLFRCQFQCPADDQGNRHRAGIHHQNMLQTERQQARGWQDLIDRVDLGGHGLILPWLGTPLSHTNTKPMPSGLLQAALNVRSLIEDESTDIDNLISASTESREKPEPSTCCACFGLLRLQDRSQLSHIGGLVPELQGCEAAALSLRSQTKG